MAENLWLDPFKCVWNDLTDPLNNWERVRAEESQKVASMTISQVYDYIQFIVESDWRMQAYHSWIMVSIFRIVRVSGISAAAEYKQAIIFILTKVKQRLAGKTILKQGISMRSTKRHLIHC